MGPLKQEENLKPFTLFDSGTTGIIKISSSDSGITVQPTSKRERETLVNLDSAYRAFLNGNEKELLDFLTTSYSVFNENPILWRAVFVNLGSRLEKEGHFYEAGLTYERISIFESNQGLKETYTSKAGDMFKKGTREYHGKNTLKKQECIKKGMDFFLGLGDLSSYAVIAREAVNMDGSGFTTAILDQVSKKFSEILNIKDHKDNLTEDQVKELVTTFFVLQFSSNKYKLDLEFITQEFKQNYFDKIPAPLKPAAREGIKGYSQNVFDSYASHFETENERKTRLANEVKIERETNLRTDVDQLSIPREFSDSSNLHISNLLDLRLGDPSEYQTALNNIKTPALREKVQELIETIILTYKIYDNNQNNIDKLSSQKRNELVEISDQIMRDIDVFIKDLTEGPLSKRDQNQNFYLSAIETTINKIKEKENVFITALNT